MLIIMIYLVKNAGFPQLREVTKGFFLIVLLVPDLMVNSLVFPPVLFVGFCSPV
jgi:hypothetical protein